MTVSALTSVKNEFIKEFILIPPFGPMGAETEVPRQYPQVELGNGSLPGTLESCCQPVLGILNPKGPVGLAQQKVASPGILGRAPA